MIIHIQLEQTCQLCSQSTIPVLDGKLNADTQLLFSKDLECIFFSCLFINLL